MLATIIVAVVGLITTAAAPLLQTQLESRKERASWQRDQRSEVYADALVYAQHLESSLQRLVEPMTSPSAKPMEVAHADIITARMRLLATSKVFDAWLEFRQFEDGFWWTVREDYPALGYEDSFDGLPTDYGDLMKLRQKLTAFYLATRLEFTTEPES